MHNKLTQHSARMNISSIRFEDHLTEILENDRPAWDKANEYHLKTVTVYFVDFQTGGYVEVDMTSTIGEVLQDKRYRYISF